MSGSWTQVKPALATYPFFCIFNVLYAHQHRGSTTLRNYKIGMSSIYVSQNSNFMFNYDIYLHDLMQTKSWLPLLWVLLLPFKRGFQVHHKTLSATVYTIDFYFNSPSTWNVFHFSFIIHHKKWVYISMLGFSSFLNLLTFHSSLSTHVLGPRFSWITLKKIPNLFKLSNKKISQLCSTSSKHFLIKKIPKS